MKLSDFHLTPTLVLPEQLTIFRVQRRRSLPNSVAYGALRVAPAGLLKNRFDLALTEVGYFAESPDTPVYETLARREADFLSIRTVGRRALLTLRVVLPITLLDLRPHANAFPVLQSLRYSVTQEIAAQAHQEGYEGIAYRSAQQYGSDCFSIFGEAMHALRLVSSIPLVETSNGRPHRVVARVQEGAQIPLVP